MNKNGLTSTRVAQKYPRNLTLELFVVPDMLRKKLASLSFIRTKGLAPFTQLVKVRWGKLVLALLSIRFS